EAISVKELAGLLGQLDRGVRVVALMSQCFSGAFANLMSVRTRDGEPSGTVCGYFSSTADRPAYGCYPENRGKDNVGHSFHFFQALETSPAFPQAPLAILATDRTPDVPIRTPPARPRSGTGTGSSGRRRSATSTRPTWAASSLRTRTGASASAPRASPSSRPTGAGDWRTRCSPTSLPSRTPTRRPTDACARCA